MKFRDARGMCSRADVLLKMTQEQELCRPGPPRGTAAELGLEATELRSSLDWMEVLHFLNCFGTLLQLTDSVMDPERLLQSIVCDDSDGASQELVTSLLAFLSRDGRLPKSIDGSLRAKVRSLWREFFDEHPDRLCGSDSEWATMAASDR